MNIRNSRTTVLLPLFLAIVLIIGIFIGIKLGKNGISERFMIYPRTDKINSVLNLIDDSYVDTVSREKLEKTAIDGMLETLDPHSVYIPAEELEEVNEPLAGNFGGIGVEFNLLSDTIIVVNTIANGPSERIGVKAGDRIVKVNDSIIAGIKINSDMVVKKLKGVEGSKVKISVKRMGVAGLIDFTITRGIIPIFSVDASYMMNEHTGYIKINKFAKTTYDEFLKAAKTLHSKGMKKLIIDLRGNGGGYIDAATKIADEFLDDKKLIVYTAGRTRPRVNFYSTKGGECVHDSLVILTDEYTASASEIFAGAIQDNDRGLIMGRRTFGKGLVQEQSPLPGGAAVRLTIARYYTPTGRCIQKPYKNGKEDYNDELHKRFLHGELKQADSIKFNKSEKFKTPGGHIVYGGGGIMPDIFIPLDTTFISDFYYKVVDKGIINKFAFQYSDANRSKFRKLKNVRELQVELEKLKYFDHFIAFAKAAKIEAKAGDLKISGKYLQVQLKALIARNFFDNEGFYPIFNSMDLTINNALDTLNKKK
jgi:carboxyl-terminal processing protease